MCNCVNEMEKKMKKLVGAESVEAPVELLTGRVYLEFTVKRAGKKKEKKMPLLLPRCPFCGEPYINGQGKRG